MNTLTALPWPTVLPPVQCPSDMVQGGDWVKDLPKKKAVSCLLPISVHRITTWVPRPNTWELMGWQHRTHSPSPSHENTVDQCYVVHPTDVHVTQSTAVPKLLWHWLLGHADVLLPKCVEGTAALPLTVFQRHAAYCKHLLIIKSCTLESKHLTWRRCAHLHMLQRVS